MGTMEEALLQDHGSEIEVTVTAATKTGSTGVWFRSLVTTCLSCRSGDELTDGGHMMVPSMGQAIYLISSASFATSSTNDRSGTVHMVPLT